MLVTSCAALVTEPGSAGSGSVATGGVVDGAGVVVDGGVVVGGGVVDGGGVVASGGEVASELDGCPSGGAVTTVAPVCAGSSVRWSPSPSVAVAVAVAVAVPTGARVPEDVEGASRAGADDVPGCEAVPPAAAPPAAEVDDECVCDPEELELELEPELELELELELDDDSSSAQAIGLPDTAAPIPKATANAPTRPT